MQCPQCGTQYRVTEESLDQKLECASCHRTFFPKAMVGKRAKAQDHTKTYVIFGGVAVAVIASFFLLSSNGDEKSKPKPTATADQGSTYTRGTHPRAAQIAAWAQAIAANNVLVEGTHSDTRAVAALFGLPEDATSGDLTQAYQTHEAARFLRELDGRSAMLSTDAAMDDQRGTAIVYLTAKPGDDTYSSKTRGEVEVSFRMDGTQVKVTGWKVTLPPERNPGKARPAAGKGGQVAAPNTAIAEATVTEITDDAGTRKVKESKVTPVAHWDAASPELRAKADAVVADILRSVTDNMPVLYNKAMKKVETLDDRKATVPRVLNAINDLYADVNANNDKIVPLTKALEAMTGFAANYPKTGTGDAAKDKTARESSIRQYFAYWYQYGNSDLSRYFETEESLEMPTTPTNSPKEKK